MDYSIVESGSCLGGTGWAFLLSGWTLRPWKRPDGTSRYIQYWGVYNCQNISRDQSFEEITVKNNSQYGVVFSTGIYLK